MSALDPMSGKELHEARRTLGELMGLGRTVHANELGRALGLKSAKGEPGETVRDWERRDGPTGPAAAAVRAWLRETERGHVPPELLWATSR